MSTILARLTALESRATALELAATGNAELVARASSDASTAVSDVTGLTDRVAAVEGEIGTDAPADPAPAPAPTPVTTTIDPVTGNVVTG